VTTAQRSEDRDGNRHYIYPPTGEPLVSVTTVLSATEGKPYLVPWSARLAAEYAVDNLGMLGKVREAEGWKAAVDLAKKQAEIVRGLKRDAGTYVHDVVEALILWAASPGRSGAEIILPVLPDHLAGADYDDQPLEDAVDWMIEGFLHFVDDFRPEFLATEMTVFNQPLGVAGTLDIILALLRLGIGSAGRFVPAVGGRVTLCVDVKTGKHPDATWPEQIGTYRRMPEALMPMGDIVPMPATDAGAVLHLRPEYERGYRLMLISGATDERAAATFLNALSLYHDRKSAKAKPGKVVYALRPDGTMPQPRLADLDGEGYGRAISPLVKAGITDLEQLAAMTAGQLKATKGVGPATIDSVRVMLADHGLHLSGEATPTRRQPDMSLLDIQRRGQQIGRLRIGQQVATDSGKMRPSRLDTFRFTTQSRPTAEAIAALYGGTIRDWEGQFEVITKESAIGVTVPPRDEVISQWYEMWSKGGCQRRCDSQSEQISGGPCLCPHAANPADEADVAAKALERSRLASLNPPQACKIVTRISVMIPDLPGLGVFRLDTGSYYAAVEIGDSAALMQMARDKGVFLPAMLRIEHRSRVAGGTTKKFPVPVLEVLATFRDLATGAIEAGGMAAQLPPAPGEKPKAITGRQAPAPARAAAKPAQARRTGPVRTAQDIADAAMQASTREDVRVLIAEAKQNGLGGEQVYSDQGDGEVWETLASLTTGWLNKLPEAGEAA
jgi:hypothetical protein